MHSTVYCKLHQELRRPIKPQWIKSHQDTKLTYNKLSADAKLNVDVDELATKFHTLPKAKPRRSTAHIPAIRVSISINKVRYYGNLNANIRFHVNDAYLRNYLQTKHKWTNKQWDKVDIPSFGRHLKKLPPKHHPAHIKFVHDLQPLGMTNFRSKNPRPNAEKMPLL